MSDMTHLQSFQDQIQQYLLRHRSILDTTSKFQETNAKVNRAIMKSVTECGCLEIHASKQKYPADGSLEQLKDMMETHIQGKLCEHCEDIIISEIGKNLFYLLSIMNLLDIKIEDVIKKEKQKLDTLGLFNLS